MTGAAAKTTDSRRTRARTDWSGWWRRWERQQTGYLPLREARFDAMFTLLEVTQPPKFRAVDLASGPGGLSERLLRRFPSSQVEAVDLDPVLLRLGREAVGTARGRLTWIDGDLRHDAWTGALRARPVDAVLSTTALHWLNRPELRRLYSTVHGVLRPGGIFENGDAMAYPRRSPGMNRAAGAVSARATGAYRGRTGSESWEDWWAAIAREPALSRELAARAGRIPQAHRREPKVPLRAHEALLRAAGFREVGTIWSHFNNRVLAAIA
ncbi:MAG: class I SAM-dependent methyltransferase [Thermoplasmata archaeon]